MTQFANPDDVLKPLPPGIFAFLENLIAKLEADARKDDLPNEARQELLAYAEHTRMVLRACRERDVMAQVLVKDEVKKHQRDAKALSLASYVRAEIHRQEALWETPTASVEPNLG